MDAFEGDPLFKVDDDGHLRFTYRGLQKELLSRVTADDVRWAEAQSDQLSSRQWRDAFRAARYSDPMTARFISAVQARLHLAETIDAGFNARRSDYWPNQHWPQAFAALRSVPNAVGASFKSLH